MLKSTLTEEKDPLGAMLLDYMGGDKTAFVQVASPQLDMSEMTGKTMFRGQEEMDGLEHRALGLCRGRILDVGAGSGCHSLILQAEDKDVTALEISPGCMKVLESRGVEKRIFASLFSLKDQRFDTILMLMNGVGICCTIEGLNFFLQHIRRMVRPGGQILADSTDIAAMYTGQALVPDESASYYGETEFTMSYRGIRSDPFDWLYIDYATLEFYAEFHGWRCEPVMKAQGGKYLARLY